jgi:hypothetical protein
MERICSRNPGPSAWPWTSAAGMAAARMTFSSSPVIVSVQPLSLGISRTPRTSLDGITPCCLSRPAMSVNRPALRLGVDDVRRAHPGDRAALVDIVAVAFAHDPAWTFLLGADYGRLAPRFAGALFGPGSTREACG